MDSGVCFFVVIRQYVKIIKFETIKSNKIIIEKKNVYKYKYLKYLMFYGRYVKISGK